MPTTALKIHSAKSKRKAKGRRLTEEVIEALKLPPAGERAAYHDDDATAWHLIRDGKKVTSRRVPGLYLRVTSDGAKTWWLSKWWTPPGKRKGETYHLRLGNPPATDLFAAREKARKTLEDLAEAKDPKQRHETSEYDFDVVAKAFLASTKADRSHEEVRRMVERSLIPQWSGRDIRTIGRRECVVVLNTIAARAPVMANRTSSVLSRIFTYAIRQGLLDAHPIALFRPGGKEEPRERHLTDDEIRALWASAEQRGYPFGTIDKLLLLTGQRRGEVGAMKWSDLDFTARTWLIPHPKNKLPHVVPLTDLAAHLIATAPRFEGRTLVFPSLRGDRPLSGWSKQAEERRDALGADDVRLHDVRRTVRTRLSECGVSPDIAERVIGHKLSGVRGIYDRYEYLAEKRDALERWELRLTEILLAEENN